MIHLDGKATSLEIQSEISEAVQERVRRGIRAPHLAAILVGNNAASEVYVGHKIKACERVGFSSTLVRLDENIRQEQLLEEISALNESEDIDGFIVQLPLPSHLNELEVIEAIRPEKDVDGFHPINAGKMMLGLPGFAPATPAGIMELIRRWGIETKGKHAVVVGRSHIVGTPISVMLSRPGIDASVTLCHSRTADLASITRQADILVVAVGRAEMISPDMIKKGAVVIDVGMNSIPDESRKSGRRLVGDVSRSAQDVAGALTPVPGGVGPMTIAALLLNTLKAAN
jgi:methylenetetrahydrofolate dehydrogenase (NADP+)/methenyltetrahydrofolate cyclohydrolase